MKKKIVILVIALFAFTLLLSGCTPMSLDMPERVIVSGGGKMPSPCGGKANFSFRVDIYNMVFDDALQLIEWEIKGRVTYIDRSAPDGGIRLVGTVTDLFIDGDSGAIVGTYDNGNGTFSFVPYDGGDDSEDSFSISITTGAYAGYNNEEDIISGNIRGTSFYPEETE